MPLFSHLGHDSTVPQNGSAERVVERMTTSDGTQRRLKFYGLGDYASYWQRERAAEVVEHCDVLSTTQGISEILELHNAQLFVQNGLLPSSYTDGQRKACHALLPALRRTIGKFLNAITEENIASIIVGVDFEYRADLLDLLSRHKVCDRCGATTVLQVLASNGIGLGEIFASKELVRSCDVELRERLMSDPANGEYLVRKYIEKDARRGIYLPPSLTTHDARSLLDSYIDSNDAHPNLLELISLARVTKDGAVDAKLKLKAKRKHERWIEDFFKKNSGIKTGCEVAISEVQERAVESSLDEHVAKLSYSRRWLEDSLEPASILNNFLYLFEFADRRMLLTFPSYPAQLGVFERFLRVEGRDFYLTGAAFNFTERAAFLQTLMYERFLGSMGVELESVIAWFFADYLEAEFGASYFRFAPSSRGSTYLEKSRHIFAEMESVVRQFTLYVENGELDSGLLAIVSEQVSYRGLPSLTEGKYVYPSSNEDIQRIPRLLFSDQSGLTYINEALRGGDAARLLTDNVVAYEDFLDFQRGYVDYLIQLGVLTNSGPRVHFASADHFLVLKNLFDSEAASYYHYPPSVRDLIDEMVAKGWLVRRGSLLTEAEARYFNYCLNQTDFSNGPDLRNKYLHGSQANSDDEDAHLRTYVTALKLLIALVIKMNDDFCLRDDEKGNSLREA